MSLPVRQTRSRGLMPMIVFGTAAASAWSRRRLIGWLILLVAAHPAAALAQSTDYPSRTIHLVIPNTVGGTSDILGRLIGSRLSDALGQPVIIESKPGAAGRIALEYMAKAAPDGYTILLGNNGTNAIVPSGQSGNEVAEDAPLVPVIKLASLAIVMAASPKLGVRSLGDVIRRARSTPEALAYASSGIGSTSHMAAALLCERAGIRLLQIPYAGTASAVKDVLAGEVPLLFTHLATVATLIRGGQLRALAVTGPHRAAAFPDVPTVAESGFPDFDVQTWHGVLLPPGTPRDIVLRLHRELTRILARDDLRAQLANLGMEPQGGSPEEFAADIKADRQHWATVIRDAGLPTR